MSTPSQEHLLLVEETASRLAEHWPVVRIFVSRPTDNGQDNTESFTTGRGDIFSQLGHARQWLTRQDEIVRASAREDMEQ